MASAGVTTREIDLSTRVPAFPGVYGGIVIPAKKGSLTKPVLITGETDLLRLYTPNQTVEVGMDLSYYAALAFLQKSDKLWVQRVANNALQGGAVIKSASAAYPNLPLAAGLADPTAYVFDSTANPAVSDISSYKTVAATSLGGLYFLIASPSTAYYVWFNTGSSVDPAVAGKTGIAVAIAPTDTANQVASKTAAVLAAQGWVVSAVAVADLLTVTVSAGAPLAAPAAGTSTFTFTQVQTGLASGPGADELILLYGKDPGKWNNDVLCRITNYATNPTKVKEPNAFVIDVYLTSNLSVPVESHTVSRKIGHKDGFGRNIFIEDVLEGSNYIRAISNPAVAETVLPKDQLVSLAFAYGNDGAAVTDAQMIQGLEKFSNTEDIFVTVLMDGGWATPAYQTALYALCENREDCVATLSTPYAAEASNDYLNEIINYRKIDLNANTSYAAIYSPHARIYDKYNDRYLYVDPSGYAAAAISDTGSNYELWYPPAGFRRGMLQVLDLRRRFSKAEMDLLYDNGINPLRFTPGRGILIWGQKTLLSRPSALDRLNVRLLLIQIKPAIKAALEDFLFELNDEATRSLATAMVESYMDGIKARRGVYDYSVVCDASNNSPDDIDNHIMNLWLFIKPTPSLEYIPFTVIITRTGVDFSVAAQAL